MNFQLLLINSSIFSSPRTLLAGTAYKAGAVLGKVTATGKYTLVDNSKSDGTEAPKYTETITTHVLPHWKPAAKS